MTTHAAAARVLLAAALAGCAQIQSMFAAEQGTLGAESKASRQYDDGQHLAAAKSLQSALDLG